MRLRLREFHHFTRLRLLIAAAGTLALACNGGVTGPEENAEGTGVFTPPVIGADGDQWDQALSSREVDYGQALRGASLKLVGDLPTLAEIKFVADAADQKSAYEAVIDGYLEDPRFARQMRRFFRDTFKMGGGSLDGAPTFAAQLVAEGRSYMELLTATSGTCPTLDGATGVFTPADCMDSGAPVKAGILTDPNVQAQFYSNMAFRRVRWVQETFDCTKYPAEVTTPVDVGGASAYTSPWPFESIAGVETGGRVDFRDVSSVTCANCHTTMNHQAPLFAGFDEEGMWQPSFVVPVPIEGAPPAVLADYLPDGESMAWRLGHPVADLASFGAAMAADPEVAECAVARVWNFAMGKGDIVAALAIVPASVIQQQVASFQQNGYQLKETIRQVFTSDDFVKF